MEITATADLTATNPYFGLFIDPTEWLDMINQNNILDAYLTADPTQTFTSNTYTYDAAGRVATIVSVDTDGDTTPPTSITTTTTLTYGEN